MSRVSRPVNLFMEVKASAGERDPFHDERSISAVLGDLVRDPARVLLRGWNWKSAILSPLFRGCLFFLTNLSAGVFAASAALLTEFVFRALLSGFYGAATEAFRSAQPHWAATLTVMALLPLTNHSVEFLIHWLRHTPALLTSIGASMALTSVSTAFNLFAMRRVVLVVGAQSQPLQRDLIRMPALMLGFLWAVVTGVRSLFGRFGNLVRSQTGRRFRSLQEGE